MNRKISRLDRRQFIRGLSGFALALPAFECFAETTKAVAQKPKNRFATFYMPDGVPMPLREDPAFKEWSWFPHGAGEDFTLTKCLDPLEDLRDNITIFSGLSHPKVRDVMGHSNADQFLTAGNTGARGDYENSISLDQVVAEHTGKHTRFSSLVLSTDGGTGSPRGAQTLSFNESGRPIPAEHRPKRIFDMLFATNDKDAARNLAMSSSALDCLLEDARSLNRSLSKHDQQRFQEYMQSVRETEIKVEKAKRWLDIPFAQVDVDHLNLDVTPEDPRNYLRTMYELIYLAFKTDSTRVATYQLGRENAVGISDYLARAVGFNLTHQLTHEVKKPGGWRNFGVYCNFLSEELARFIKRLESTPEPGGEGYMLDNTMVLFGSASSAFHLSRNYPLILAGGKNMGFQHGQYLKLGEGNEDHQATAGFDTDLGWRSAMEYEEVPLSNLYLTMLQKFGIETDSFADSTGTLSDV